MTQDDAILAAVRAEVIAYGFRRATMTSVARRAGMSRATLYRRGATLDDLVREALVADFAAAASDALPQVPANEPAGEPANEPADGEAGAVTRDVIVRAAITTLEALSTEFTQALIEHDPELLLPYLVERVGRSQRSILDALSAAIALAQLDGSVRDAPADVLAMGAMQALMPYLVSRRPLEQIAPRQVWLAEAAHLLDGYLAPSPAASDHRTTPTEGRS
ncbi:TetR/AcrR family transcriptional regulator [Dermacoccus nishinomiyaensis]|uniref:TetR/AcrR family transcriptional regulator n=1 Tax=Dermacoccus nishinomiyaensis TaxID=1274 RepID=UPI00248E699E|nr:helix-turn-helix domain-containing protein [Dermacoccus nishinomiyaensis]